MADLLSVAGSVVGIISLGIQVTQSLYDFYSACKRQQSDVARTTKKLEHLLGVLETFQDRLAQRAFSADERTLLKNIESSIQNCEECIHELQDETNKFKDDSASGIRAVARTAARKIAYPFRQSTLQALDEDVEEIVSHLSLALQVLQQKDIGNVQGDLEDTKAVLNLVRADQISSAIREWLKAPDATINYNDACKKRHPSTGLWFVKGSPFSAWLTKPNSFLWLYGFAGCGKSVLCSTAIQYTFRHRRSNPRIGLAFFFFTFNDDAKQNISAMLRALVLQLSGQLNNNHGFLSRLHNSYRNAMPPDEALIGALRQLVRAFGDTYIILDALDESPRDTHRGDVLQALGDIRAWSEPGLHLLVTSRAEPDICVELRAVGDKAISMKNDSVDADIAAFISNHLENNRRLRKWEEHRAQIKAALTARAKGVFRWVECQFKALESCPECDDLLGRLLDSLPQSLDATYERMLLNIPLASVEYAQRMLAFLCCAKRPLTAPELIDGIAVELSDPPKFNPRRRLKNIDAIHQVCPGLIEMDEPPGGKPATVRIAHFSVQEYLESDRISQQVAGFKVSKPKAHAEIATICLTYLLEPAPSDPEQIQYPLAPYAAKRWPEHLHDGDKGMPHCQAIRLFQSTGGEFQNWVRIWNVDHWSGQKPDGEAPSPIYYASLLGLDSVIAGLLCRKSIRSSLGKPDVSKLINEQGGEYGNALQAASAEGHEAIVQRLLANGADVNAQGGKYGNALQAASAKGHKAIVQGLFDNGADVNARGGLSLQTASARSYEAIVQLLLDNGADVNAKGGIHGSALQAASAGGHESIVQRLFDKGADVNAQGGKYGTALQAALKGNHETIVQMLLDKDGKYGNALQTALAKGYKAIAQQLFDKGADVNAQAVEWNALQAASAKGHEAIVQLLLDNGANVNAQGGEYVNALQAASAEGHEAIVQLLFDNGADVDAQGGKYGNALQAASAEGHEVIVQLLLDNGADVNAQGGNYGNALQAASAKGHEAIVQRLLDNGADVNAQGGDYGNALQAALREGHKAIARRLYDKGADVNAPVGRYGNVLKVASAKSYEVIIQRLLDKDEKYGHALQMASAEGRETIVQRLFDKFVDVNAQGGMYGNALQAASARGHEAIAQWLLDKCANVNAQGGMHGTALQAASAGGYEAIVQLLLDNGADVNAKGGIHGSALQAASAGGHKAIVQLLLDNGAILPRRAESNDNPLIVEVRDAPPGQVLG